MSRSIAVAFAASAVLHMACIGHPSAGTDAGTDGGMDGGMDGGADAGNGTSLDWPTYLHDNLRTSTAPLETKLSPSTAPNLKLLWTFRTGGTIEASPIIVGNVLYVGSWDGHEYAVDAIDGGQIWKSPFLEPTWVAATGTLRIKESAQAQLWWVTPFTSAGAVRSRGRRIRSGTR